MSKTNFIEIIFFFSEWEEVQLPPLPCSKSTLTYILITYYCYHA